MGGVIAKWTVGVSVGTPARPLSKDGKPVPERTTPEVTLTVSSPEGTRVVKRKRLRRKSGSHS